MDSVIYCGLAIFFPHNTPEEAGRSVNLPTTAASVALARWVGRKKEERRERVSGDGGGSDGSRGIQKEVRGSKNVRRGRLRSIERSILAILLPAREWARENGKGTAEQVMNVKNKRRKGR